MKKISVSIFGILLSLLFFIMPFSSIKIAHAEDKSITVYSVEDYIDPSLLEGFTNDTGITVNYYTFASNEEIYNEFIKNPSDANLMCVSEYMIMKMKEEKRIKEFTYPETYKESLSSYIDEKFKSLELADEEKTYTAGYMWGTMGYVYNMNKGIKESDLKNWDSIKNSKFYDKVTIKDSIRDTYIMAVGAVYKDELLALDKDDPLYNENLTEIFNRTDSKTVDKVENYLTDLKQNLYCFEVDSAKQDIIRQKIDVYFAWSGDAVYAIESAQEAGVTLGYTIPEEGSNVWFDGLVMSNATTGEKEDYCKQFIDYISDGENVVTNMDYIGYTSVIANEEVFNYIDESYSVEDGEKSMDLSYFFGEGEEDEYIITTDYLTYQMLYAQYPDEDTINRCAVMQNFSSESLTRINAMWTRVKLITFSNTGMIIAIVIFALFIIGIICFKFREKIYKFYTNIRSKNKGVKKPPKYKIIKIEKL